MIARILTCSFMVLLMGIMCASPTPESGLNPFLDISAVTLDGQARAMTTSIAPLGSLQQGQTLRIRAEGEGLEAVLILTTDTESLNSGVIVGGGPPATTFQYAIAETGAYYVYVMFAPDVADSDQRATLSVEVTTEDFQPPSIQYVRIAFDEGYLTEPGLVDPDSFQEDEIQLLRDLEEIVQQEVLVTLREIFADTPIEILAPDDVAPAGPVSQLTFSPQRVVPEGLETFDAAIPAVAPDSPCAEVVLFGEVLPSHAGTDAGNFIHDDQAIVYVGSFQGRGFACRTAVVESLNNIVLALSHTAAHEIGHLVGLYHVSLVDIMDRRPTSAFQRRLGFERGQILVEIPVVDSDGGVDVETRVLTTIIQDPQRYFVLNFAQ